MGKLGKEMVDQIHTLLGEGYNKTEVASKLGITRKTVGKYADDTESLVVQKDSGKAGVSLDSEITKIVYDMMGVMGAPSRVGAVKQAYKDEVSIAKLRVTHWPIYADEDEEFTVEGMIERLLSYIDDTEDNLRDCIKGLREGVTERERLKEFAEERYEEGLERGREDHAIYVRCAYCGKPYQVTPQTETHGVVSENLQKLGWGHRSCVRKNEYNRSAGSRELETALNRF